MELRGIATFLSLRDLTKSRRGNLLQNRHCGFAVGLAWRALRSNSPILANPIILESLDFAKSLESFL